MTQETMTIHRALVELKTIDKRINSAIHNATFCTSAKHDAKKLFGEPAEKFVEDATASFTQINDLIARRNAIKAAIPVSNATTMVTVGDKTMTVAEAIVMKQNGFQPYQTLLDTLKQQYSDAVTEVEIENNTLDKRADAYVTSLYGGDKTAKDSEPEKVDLARKTYINTNTLEVFDGFKGTKQSITARIQELETMISTFQNDLDAALSVSNATTTIAVTY